ncbi:hypothetical protein N780_12685 [Pontibacillus chungwhensis BH030062]|uniref:Uncharacterized protein n=1 Tax=Pontibacillus chungwhensis BH030062 TaxID=1385513 RepID=A0A0A2UYF9_9BACI|nr:hypothetical protein N780_12685 [Pontibacillus chungwhensis BH030062]
MFSALIISGVAWFATFFAIYWLPFARVPLSSDFFLLAILAPVDFLFGSLCLLVACINHGLLFRALVQTNVRSEVKVLSLLGWLSPAVLVIFSIKVVAIVFCMSVIYGILSMERKRNKRGNVRRRSL